MNNKKDCFDIIILLQRYCCIITSAMALAMSAGGSLSTLKKWQVEGRKKSSCVRLTWDRVSKLFENINIYDIATFKYDNEYLKLCSDCLDLVKNRCIITSSDTERNIRSVLDSNVCSITSVINSNRLRSTGSMILSCFRNTFLDLKRK